MSEMITSGTWLVKDGEDEAFVAEWTSYAQWASTMPGASTLHLGHDTANPSRYVSFAVWSDIESVRAWKSHPDFPEYMGRVRAHVAGFEGLELDVAAATATATVTTVGTA